MKEVYWSMVGASIVLTAMGFFKVEPMITVSAWTVVGLIVAVVCGPLSRHL